MSSESAIPPGGLPLITGAQAGEADRAAVAAGDTWDGLLARAGGALARGVVEVLRARQGGVYGRRVVIAVGKGDNGGDGWVCADRLRARGVSVTVVAPHGLDVELSDHSARARAHWLASGGRVTTDLRPLEDWPREHVRQPVLVDCLLGTGATGAPRGPAKDAVAAIAGAADALAVVACDVPSGVDADTGAVADPALAVRAAVTVTFGAAKRGLLLHPGAVHAGSLRVADLGPRWALPELAEDQQWVATGDRDAVPAPWQPDDDKRSRGRLVVLAGSSRYGGAVVLSATAAARTGAGLVTACTSADPVPVLVSEPALMVTELPAAEDGVGGPSVDAIEAVRRAVADADAVVVGPGLGHEDTTREVVEAVLDAAAADTGMDGARAVVLDADGLNVFRHEAAALRGRGVRLVLTPHERELARLLDEDPDAVASDRHAAACRLADVAGATVVAKGPRTLVVNADGRTTVVTSGSPALGTGGTGDVLAGMLGAALARDRGSLRPGVAGLVAGVCHLHGLAGERAGSRTGGRPTASDVLDALPPLLRELTATHRPGGHW